MTPKVIEWDGSHLPKELEKLPPGRYAIESVDEPPALTEEEEKGIVAALSALDAGEGVPLTKVLREIRSGSSKR